MGIYCFIHICCIPKGIEVFKDQLLLIKKSGLLNTLDKIYIGLLGDYKHFLHLKEYLDEPKLLVVNFSPDISEMEFPTLSSIKDFCDKESTNHQILYIHTKNDIYIFIQNIRNTACRVLYNHYVALAIVPSWAE